MSRSALSIAALVAAMGSMPLGAEILPRNDYPDDKLRDALRLAGRVTSRDAVRGAFGGSKPKRGHQRLKRATGPGSYDEWKAALAAERVAKRLKAAV